MPTIDETQWHQPAAELMAREGLSLAEAATRLRVPVTKEGAANLFRTKGFQRLLRAERLRFYLELGTDQNWSKKTAIGMLLHDAAQLRAEGQYDKAADVILKATKIEGWLGSDTQVSVFNGLSARDFEAIRAKLRAEQKPSEPTN